jgi:hypothetical protein
MDKKSNRNLLAVIDLKNMAKDRGAKSPHPSHNFTTSPSIASIGKVDL